MAEDEADVAPDVISWISEGNAGADAVELVDGERIEDAERRCLRLKLRTEDGAEGQARSAEFWQQVLLMAGAATLMAGTVAPATAQRHSDPDGEVARLALAAPVTYDNK